MITTFPVGVIGGPCILVQSIAITVRFLITLSKEGDEHGFIWCAGTHHI